MVVKVTGPTEICDLDSDLTFSSKKQKAKGLIQQN